MRHTQRSGHTAVGLSFDAHGKRIKASRQESQHSEIVTVHDLDHLLRPLSRDIIVPHVHDVRIYSMFLPDLRVLANRCKI